MRQLTSQKLLLFLKPKGVLLLQGSKLDGNQYPAQRLLLPGIGFQFEREAIEQNIWAIERQNGSINLETEQRLLRHAYGLTSL